MSLAIETAQLSKKYGNNEVLRSVDLKVQTGGIHAIVGPNGCGKTTLLKALAGLVQPSSGTVRLFDEVVLDGAALRERVHYVSSDVHLYPYFKVRDILRYASLLYPQWDPNREELLMDAFRLPKGEPVRKLSLGMKMRLRMVIALSMHADLLLMDEATNGLDPAAKDQILDLLLQESALRDVTIVMATHQLFEVERAADTISVLLNGTLLTTWGLDDLQEQVHEVHTVLAKPAADGLAELPGILEVVDDGQSQTVTWISPPDEIGRLLRSMGADYVDIKPASIDRWFQSLLKKEGVSSGKIVLPQRAVL